MVGGLGVERAQGSGGRHDVGGLIAQRCGGPAAGVHEVLAAIACGAEGVTGSAAGAAQATHDALHVGLVLPQQQRGGLRVSGELRLQVFPRNAQVFVDGYYAGIVDDYDGTFQGLKLEAGPYHIEVVAPGFEPLEFDVRILPGQKIEYRGDLIIKRP